MTAAADGRGDARRRRALFPVALLTAMMTSLAVAGVAAASVTITSPGPVASIALSGDLACQVTMANDSRGAFFDGGPTGACGTFLQTNPLGLAFDTNNAELFSPAGLPGATQASTQHYVTDEQTAITGSGTVTSPYSVTTVVNACVPGLNVSYESDGEDGECPSGDIFVAALRETDTYVTGSNEYATKLVISNESDQPLSGTLYHTGQCFLAATVGYGALGGSGDNAPECTLTPGDSPPGRVMSFIPITPGSSYYEGTNFWSYVTPAGAQYPDTIDASSKGENGMGLSWPYSLARDATETISYDSLVAPNDPPSNTALPVLSLSPTDSQTLSCSQGTWTSAAPITYTYQWLRDGSAITGATDSTYTVATADLGHLLACQVTANTDDGSASATSAPTAKPESVTVASPPVVVAGPTTVTGPAGAAFAAGVNPEGLPTTFHFEYGLDPKYGLTTASDIYVNSTPEQALAPGASLDPVTALAVDLVPDALYHVRVVATNADGTTVGPDETFTTAALPPPPPPVLGKEANFVPVSGLVYVKAPPGARIAAVRPNATTGRNFIPLTQALQLPVGTQVDARHGKLRLATATTRKSKHARAKSQSGLFFGGLFAVGQSGSTNLHGLTVLQLLDNGVFPGAPSYSGCTAGAKISHTTAVIAKKKPLSNKVLQTLGANEHGNYKTKGKYSAATVRGTKFTVSDRCDGTLTHVSHGEVTVTVFRTHKHVTLRTGQSYFAKAP
ncbi:MAG TPA: hypothetical protein VG295_12520 [Solirubrobacteraceae bacterium]|nr:hypothetical protein [Solirubrobacteraceae bacterium]